MVVNFVDIGGIVDHHCLKPSLYNSIQRQHFENRTTTHKSNLTLCVAFSYDKRLIHSLYVGSDLKVPPLGAI